MKFALESITTAKSATIAIPLLKTKTVPKSIKDVLPKDAVSMITSLLKEEQFKGKEGATQFIPSTSKSIPNLILLGLGKKEDLTLDDWRHVAGTIARKANSLSLSECSCLVSESLIKLGTAEELGQAFSEGAIMGAYKQTAFKTESSDPSLKKLTLLSADKSMDSGLKKGLKTGEVIGQAVCFARELANAPSNDLTPKAFLAKIKATIKGQKGFKLEIIDQKKAKSLKMDAFLGVARGSVEPPYMAVISYLPVKGKKPIGIIGKGVTFDSGGISIKPSAKMHEMKADMSGAAAVTGMVSALTQLRPKQNVLAIMPLVENMPAGNAQKPGDVVKAMNGKTIEIINTDAEGRLIMADALAYAVKKGADKLIDIATLTGAVTIALGDTRAGVMGTSQKMVDDILKAGEQTGELFWQLPLDDDYFDHLKSETADMLNCATGRLAGTITAAKFLEQFVDKHDWAHLDIAGTMDYSSTDGYKVKGMSGFGVRTLIEFLNRQ